MRNSCNVSTWLENKIKNRNTVICNEISVGCPYPNYYHMCVVHLQNAQTKHKVISLVIYRAFEYNHEYIMDHKLF